MGVILKEELCAKVMTVRRVCNRMMAVLLDFENDLLRLICGYAPQSGRIFPKNNAIMIS